MAKKKKPAKKRPSGKPGGSLRNKPRKKRLNRQIVKDKKERAYKKKVPFITQKTDSIGRVYYLDKNGKRISRDEFLRSSFKKTFGPRKWYSQYKKYLSEKKVFKAEKKKEKRPADKRIPQAGQILQSQYYINLDVINVIDHSIELNEDPVYLYYYNRKRKMTPDRLDEFKAILQDFIGDWYRSAEEQYDGSLPYYIELQEIHTFDFSKIIYRFMDFNKQAETNKDVMDLSRLETYRGKKRKVDLEILDFRKYLLDADF